MSNDAVKLTDALNDVPAKRLHAAFPLLPIPYSLLPKNSLNLFQRFNIELLHLDPGLCYNIGKTHFCRFARRLTVGLTLMVPRGVEAEGGKNKEGNPLWQLFP